MAGDVPAGFARRGLVLSAAGLPVFGLVETPVGWSLPAAREERAKGKGADCRDIGAPVCPDSPEFFRRFLDSYRGRSQQLAPFCSLGLVVSLEPLCLTLHASGSPRFALTEVALVFACVWRRRETGAIGPLFPGGKNGTNHSPAEELREGFSVAWLSLPRGALPGAV